MRKILLIVLILILTVSAASASDPSNQTFSDLQNIIDTADENTIIELDRDYSFDDNTDYPIEISKDVTINGNNHVLDGKNKTQIMSISSKVTINNVIFKNGNSPDGGAIFANTLIIKNSEFDGNDASYMGGAIFIQGLDSLKSGSLSGEDTVISTFGVINNCKFINNRATYGGAIFAQSAIVENSKFTNNNAEYGGAIDAKNTIIRDCEFIGNHADTGGAIFVDKSLILSSTFSNNVASGHGGAVYADNCLINGCEFKSNKADYGGAVTSFGSKIYNSNFDSNTANEEGGALYSFDSEIANCKFTNNKAERGEAIYGVNSQIKNCKFENNTNDLYDSEVSDESDNVEISEYYWVSTGDDTQDGMIKDTKTSSTFETPSVDKNATGNPLILLLLALFIPFVKSRKFK